MKTLFNRIYLYSIIFLQKKYYGFISGINYLSDLQKKTIFSLIEYPNNKWQLKYETELASSLGEGKVLTYAAGRMAFYSILKSLNLKKTDEVILTGFTCSVMVNAVIRIGAIPIFSDIDKDTLGSCPISISKLISSNTKVIVAQHSFGIPCEIDKIQEIAKNKNIFLIEDCALSFLSKYKGITLGNWSDAAIFSSDHSKPLNTFIGGFVYTNSNHLYNKLKDYHDSIGEIPQKQQYNIYKQLIFEGEYFKPEKYWFLKFYNLLEGLLNRFFKSRNSYTFLDEDSASKPSQNSHYPYPSKFPSFLSYLGLLELYEYKKSIENRRQLLNELINLISLKHRIPSCYSNEDNYIIPLRFAFFTDSQISNNNVSKLFDKEWFWFKKPIESTSEDITSYGYKIGSCPVSEAIGEKIINIPCIHLKDMDMLKSLEKIF